MILFKKIRYKNFISTGNQWVEFQLDKSKNTLLCGKNGSGKSTITDAITFALYGKPFRKINKPQLINSYNKGKMVCEIEFQVGNREYKVVRGQKPAIFEIYENGILINQEANSIDYQEYLINNILKINYKSFTQIVVVGSASYVPFMQLSANDRRVMIEDLFNIDVIGKMNNTLKKIISDHSKTVEQIHTKYFLLEEKVKLQNEHMKNSVESLDVLLENLLEEIKINNENILEQTNKIEELEQKLKEAEVIQNKLKKDVEAYNELQGKRASISNKIELLKKKIELASSLQECDKCGQKISEEKKKSMIETYEKEKKKYEELEMEISAYLEKNKEKVDMYEKAVSIVNDLNFKLRSEIQQKKYYENYKVKCEKDYRNILSQKEQVLNALNTDLNCLYEELGSLSIQQKELAEKTEIFNFVQNMLKDDGIKTRIIKHYLPMMNKLINKYLSLMNFKIGFELNENFEETIKNAAKRDLSYDNFSEGEKLRIDLAILFAWREITKKRTSMRTNLLILDEILDSSLDAEGTEDFLKIITKIFNENMNIFVISHKTDQIFDKFESVIKFEKPDGRFTKVSFIN